MLTLEAILTFLLAPSNALAIGAFVFAGFLGLGLSTLYYDLGPR